MRETSGAARASRTPQVISQIRVWVLKYASGWFTGVFDQPR